MKLIGKYVLIVPQEEESKSKGGFLMGVQDQAELRYKKATVVATGSDVASMKPGNFIYFDKAAGHTIRINDDLFTIVREVDVVVVL